jgi:hypothetical protein
MLNGAKVMHYGGVAKSSSLFGAEHASKARGFFPVEPDRGERIPRLRSFGAACVIVQSEGMRNS